MALHWPGNQRAARLRTGPLFTPTTVRRKYVSRQNPQAVPVIAGLTPMLQERSMPAAGLLAQIVVSKYCDHVPLYRQEQIYWTRHRVWLPRQNLARWMGMVADWLKPIYQYIRTGVMADGYVQINEVHAVFTSFI
jgi:transposase